MLLTHHPLYLRGTSTVGAHTTKGAWITDLIRAGVSLYAAHTNADSWGTAQAMADLLGLENARPLIPKEDDPTLGLGRIGTIAPVMLGELADRVADLLPRTPRESSWVVTRNEWWRQWLLAPARADSFLGLVNSSGADVYITADLRHHPATDHLWGGGAALISPTHFASEWPLLPKLAGALREMLPGLEVDVSTVVTDAWVSRR